jgi:hypothetical protein
VPWSCGLDNEFRQAATPDQRTVRFAQDREMAKRELLVAHERPLQPDSRLFHCAWPALGIKSLSDFRQCMEASEERQIVGRDPPEQEASRLQLTYAVRQCHVEDSLRAIHPPNCSAAKQRDIIADVM